jgi:hypothetical protein
VNATCAPACSGVAVCQPPPGSYTIGGIVDGLLAGQQIELANNAFWYLVVTGNGEFTFGTPLATGDGYLVEVQMGPDAGPDAGCFVMNSGGMIANANITNVAVMCP